MASIGHVAVGLAAARWRHKRVPETPRLTVAMIALSAWSLAPDLDVIAFVFRIPYDHPWGHRGATHSLSFAMLAALLVGTLARWWSTRRGR